jgi:hypothetical protein
MVTRPQSDLDADRDIFRALARNHRGQFGAWTAVTTGGAASERNAREACIPAARNA